MSRGGETGWQCDCFISWWYGVTLSIGELVRWRKYPVQYYDRMFCCRVFSYNISNYLTFLGFNIITLVINNPKHQPQPQTGWKTPWENMHYDQFGICDVIVLQLIRLRGIFRGVLLCEDLHFDSCHIFTYLFWWMWTVRFCYGASVYILFYFHIGY